MMGMVMNALAANVPAAENAWTLFTSDHGEMHLEHRIVQKMSMYEGSARVPLIVAPPAGTPGARRGVVEATFVSLLDIFPTFCDIAGAVAPGTHAAGGVVAAATSLSCVCGYFDFSV
jgi:arylsulfatase A-like enzyme